MMQEDTETKVVSQLSDALDTQVTLSSPGLGMILIMIRFTTI